MDMLTVKEIKAKMHDALGAKPSKEEALEWWERFFDRHAAVMYTRVYMSIDKYIAKMK